MLNCLLEVDRLCRYKPSYSKALELDGQANDNVDKIPSALRELRRASQPMPRITATPTKKKRRVIVIGDSLLKGTKGPICHPDLQREVCYLRGARVKDVARRVTHLVRPSDYYSLLFFFKLAVKRWQRGILGFWGN